MMADGVNTRRGKLEHSGQTALKGYESTLFDGFAGIAIAVVYDGGVSLDDPGRGWGCSFFAQFNGYDQSCIGGRVCQDDYARDGGAERCGGFGGDGFGESEWGGRELYGCDRGMDSYEYG